MSTFLQIPPSWYGVHPGGEIRVARHPTVVLQRIASEVDELHSWQGGGVAFGRKPYLGQIKRAGFRVRPLSYRRDGSVAFLVGELEFAEGETLVRYRIESPTGFVRMLPFAALAPAALLGVGGYLAAPLYAQAGVARVAFIAACSASGLVFAVLIAAVVLYGIRRDTERLLSFLESTVAR